MSGRYGYTALDKSPQQGSLLRLVTALLGLSLLANILVPTLLGVLLRAPCTKTCGDLSISCDEYCVTDIIVGGGNTGLSLAKALSDNTTRDVLVLEAGGNHVDEPLILGPGNGLFFESLYLLEPYRYHYHMLTTIQLGRRQIVSNSGRLLGGSSVINDALMFKATPRFWDDLEARTGNTGRFASEVVYEIFKSIEWLNASDVYVPDATRGQTENAWKIQPRPRVLVPGDDSNVIAQIFASSLGFTYPNLVGYNDPAATVGVFPHGDMLYDFNATLDPIVRWSSQKAFLNSSVVDSETLVGVGGRRLRVLVDSPVQRILFHPNDATKAVGVEYLDPEGVQRRAYATSNVVVSAFMHTAMLLQRSGVGPASVLADAGITPQVVNEHIGRHWKGHNYMPIVWLVPGLSGVASPEEGPLISGWGNILTEDTVLGTTAEQRGFQYITVSFPNIMAAYVFQLNSPGEGTVDVYSDDPNEIGKLEPNAFGNASAVVSWRTQLRQVITAIQTANPSVICLSIDNTTLWDDVLFEQWLYDNTDYTNSLAHSCGLTRLSDAPETGAIDPEFRVWGAQNLRVCDTNVFPEPTDGNPSYTLAAMGQICARAMLGLPPSPSDKKRKATPLKRKPATNKKKHVSSSSSFATRDITHDDYLSIVSFFNSAKTRMSPSDARRVIQSIQATSMWRNLEAQYGQYTG